MYSATTNKKFVTSLLAFFVWLPIEVQAVAYCALRDPVHAMQQFYPGFSSYRSLLGVVGPDLRGRLNEKLPYATHFNEFGKHTLYVTFQDDEAIGMVHARTEKGDWGLDELVWAFNMDMTVRDFRFQRSRSRWKDEIESAEFRRLLQGRGFHELKQLLTDDGAEIRNVGTVLPAGAEGLAATIVRSAMKTIVVTEFVWGGELEALSEPVPLGEIK